MEKVDFSFTGTNSGKIDSTDGLSTFMFELGGRVGVWDNLDLGIKYSAPGSIALDAKYQLLGRDSGSAFQLSAGLKGGYASLEGKDDKGEDVNDVPVIDLIVPVYATYNPTSWMAITLAPQFCYRISDNGYYYPEGPIAGANIGLRLGKTVGLRGEFEHEVTSRVGLQVHGQHATVAHRGVVRDIAGTAGGAVDAHRLGARGGSAVVAIHGAAIAAQGAPDRETSGETC